MKNTSASGMNAVSHNGRGLPRKLHVLKLAGMLIFIALTGMAAMSCDLFGEDDPDPAITTTGLPGGTVGTAYSQTLAATGTTPVTWSRDSGTLPAGLTLAANGTISGTPTAAGTSSFTVKATNSAGSATKQLSIVISGTQPGPDPSQPQPGLYAKTPPILPTDTRITLTTTNSINLLQAATTYINGQPAGNFTLVLGEDLSSGNRPIRHC